MLIKETITTNSHNNKMTQLQVVDVRLPSHYWYASTITVTIIVSYRACRGR